MINCYWELSTYSNNVIHVSNPKFRIHREIKTPLPHRHEPSSPLYNLLTLPNFTPFSFTRRSYTTTTNTTPAGHWQNEELGRRVCDRRPQRER
jgi:hypothetical protein